MEKESEFEKFDDVMGKLLSVPYSELKKKLDEEKEQKKKKREDRSISGARVSRTAK
ncbi:MAG: hypothetical protein WA584_08325 [Pyrinomonadaceae bacterium]